MISKIQNSFENQYSLKDIKNIRIEFIAEVK